MKYLKTYEGLITPISGKYIIVENFSGFRSKDISNVLFEVLRIVDELVEMRQLRYYFKDKLEYNATINTTGSGFSTYELTEIRPHIIYQTNDLQDAENQLDLLRNAKKYNL